LADLNTLDLSRAELAWLCGEAEWYVGTRGGIMDQFIVLLGQRDHALFLDCRAQGEGPSGLPRFRTEKVPLPDNYSLLVTDSQVRHQNTRGHFNVRVAEDRIGVALLQRHFPGVEYLRDLEPYPWAELEPLLPEKVDWDDLQRLGISLETLIDVELPRDAAPFMVRRRCRHVITENARVLESVEALRRDDIERFGELLNAAHTSVSKDYGASCKELDLLVKLARQVDGVIGTRMTGAGWGGCTITLCQQGAENAFINHVRPAYHEETGLWPDIFVCHAGPGAGLVAADEIS
jgi:galactokinase